MSSNHDLSKRIAVARKIAVHNSSRSQRIHRDNDDGLGVDELDVKGLGDKERCYNYRVLINKHEDVIKALTEELKEAKYDVNILNQKLEKEIVAKTNGDTEKNRIIGSMKDLVNKTESMNIHRDNYLISECDKLIKSIVSVESNTKSHENHKIGWKTFLGVILKLKFEIEHMKEVVKSSIRHNSREMHQIVLSHTDTGKDDNSLHTTNTTTSYEHMSYEDPHNNHNTFLDICTALETENTVLNSKIEELDNQINEFDKKELNFNKLISNYRNIIVGLKDEMTANSSQYDKAVKELNNKVHSFSVDNSVLLKKVLAFEDAHSSDNIIRKKVLGLEHECLNIDNEISQLQEEIEMSAKLLTKDYFLNVIQSNF